MKSLYRTTAVTLVACTFFISCSSGVKETPQEATAVTTTEPGIEPQADSPEALLAQDKPLDAAMLYLKNASRVEQSLRPTYQLKGAQILLDNDYSDIAANIIKDINPEELSPEQLTHLNYLQIQLALQERKATHSLELLKEFEKRDYSALTSEAGLLSLYIKSYELLNDSKQATQYRIQLEPLLLDRGEIVDNQIAIIRFFLSKEQSELAQMLETETNQSIKAWTDLSLLIKKSKNPFRLANMLNSWKSLHPTHPVTDELIAILAPQAQDLPPKLDNIALLLPLSGAYKNLGRAVRDGFLTSYYSEEISDSKPTIKIYDTSVNKDILEVYQNAVNNGADMIVGPLKKDSVTALANRGTHFVPMLALNRLEDNSFYHKNFYQFSLSPEAEAKQVARRAWLDGHNHAAVITPENKWGTRLAEAFKTEWEELGGTVSTEARYQSKKNDFSKPIKSLLAIDKSEQRKRDLVKLLRTKMRFEPRRRQDIDMIFMAAMPRQARLIPPQLEFYHAETLPIYTTSHSFTGRMNSKSDRDLNGVMIADMPWTLNNNHMAPIKKQIYRTWPNKSKQYNRLYALGTDAYNILHYLNWLRGNSNAQLEGATGGLSMNEQNQITRQLSWAKFKRGIPRQLASTVTSATRP